jgi:hypothetical protein
MSELEEHPELSSYDPAEDRPLRRRRHVVLIRIVVGLSVIALVLPGILTIASLSATNAAQACAIWVQHSAQDASGSSARFEIFGAGGIGWECYTVGAFGGDRHVTSLGLIPGEVTLPPATQNS